MISVAAAREAVEMAEAKITEGEREREEAIVLLDAALAGRGWKRVTGGFSPATAYYEQLSTGDVFERAVVLEHELAKAEAA
jgi:hypothetical protein